VARQARNAVAQVYLENQEAGLQGVLSKGNLAVCKFLG